MTRDIDDLKEKDEGQWFNGDHIDVVGDRYVAWIDIMGIRDHLQNRQVYPSILRGELLSVISEYIDSSEVELFTAGDGAIIITEDEKYLQDFLTALFTHYVKFNVKDWREDNHKIYFNRLIRAGIGYGEIHRIDIKKYSRKKNEGNPFHNDFSNDPFGPGIIDALRAEYGSPYSIHKYQSDETIDKVKWWKSSGISYDDRVEMIEMLVDYFDWYEGKHRYQYSPKKSGHLDSCLDYFEVNLSDINNS
jgi:hypothetical protein